MKRRIILGVILCSMLISGAYIWAETDAHKAAVAKDQARQKVIDQISKNFMSTPAADALLLRMLIQSRKAQRGIEVGTAVGFGSVNMGIGFERTGGHLYGVDISEKMVAETRGNIKKAGLEKTVTIVQGDALKVLPKLEGKYDFMFIDAVKSDYFKYFKAVENKLLPGAVVVGHNAIASGRAMKDWLDYMKNHPDWEMVIVKATRGMAVCYKVR
ncbi:MAG: class I SAM-dependent methyltransferase [Phycisphaerae bacterium]|nr:class I SAM-dependent methyltransferase [Phycisphaerae bacterium]